MSACFCIGPQSGQSLCPCQIIAQGALNLDTGNRVGVEAPVTYPYGIPPKIQRVGVEAQVWPQPTAQQGWECPRCKTINAPFMPTCMGCKPPKIDFTEGSKS